MTHDDHADLANVKKTLWEAEQAAYDTAKRLASEPQESVFTPQELAAAFEPSVPAYIGCMDERVQIPGMKKIGNGGSGVLFSEKQLDAFVQLLGKNGTDVRFVTWHDGCGACGLYCQQSEISADQAPFFAQKTAEQVTKHLGLKEPPRHVEFGAMTGNEHVHHARGIVVDCSGVFFPEALQKKFPASFELTAAAYPDVGQLEAELRVAIGIAEGDHGMGKEKFNALSGGQPLLLTFVEDPNNQKLTDIASATVKKVAADHQNTVKLVTLQAPKKG